MDSRTGFSKRGRSSIGRAPALHAGGCRFDPGRLHFYQKQRNSAPDRFRSGFFFARTRTRLLRKGCASEVLGNVAASDSLACGSGGYWRAAPLQPTLGKRSDQCRQEKQVADQCRQQHAKQQLSESGNGHEITEKVDAKTETTNQ